MKVSGGIFWFCIFNGGFRRSNFDVIKLKRRLTFKGVDTALVMLDKKLHSSLYENDSEEMNAEILLSSLQDIRNQLVHDHNSLFVELVEELINKIEIFFTRLRAKL